MTTNSGTLAREALACLIENVEAEKRARVEEELSIHDNIRSRRIETSERTRDARRRIREVVSVRQSLIDQLVVAAERLAADVDKLKDDLNSGPADALAVRLADTDSAVVHRVLADLAEGFKVLAIRVERRQRHAAGLKQGATSKPRKPRVKKPGKHDRALLELLLQDRYASWPRDILNATPTQLARLLSPVGGKPVSTQSIQPKRIPWFIALRDFFKRAPMAKAIPPNVLGTIEDVETREAVRGRMAELAQETEEVEDAS